MFHNIRVIVPIKCFKIYSLMNNKKYHIRSINVGKSPNYLTVNLPTSIAKKLSISKNDYVKISEYDKKIIIETLNIEDKNF